MWASPARTETPKWNPVTTYVINDTYTLLDIAVQTLLDVVWRQQQQIQQPPKSVIKILC